MSEYKEREYKKHITDSRINRIKRILGSLQAETNLITRIGGSGLSLEECLEDGIYPLLCAV